MYPAQDALPFPSRPDLNQYKKRAKDLVRACRSDRPDAIYEWAAEWLERDARQFAEFAAPYLRPPNAKEPACRLAAAQFVIARACGFTSWPALVHHFQALDDPSTKISAFERAVSAVINGNEAALASLLREHPDLVRARSSLEHRATLLHYVSANGVEGYRQKSPKNAARIAAMLLDAGAEVDATTHVYDSDCTTLGLVATSSPPAIAGVQIEVMDLLLARGARTDRPGLAGRNHSLIRACLANGQPKAAMHLARHGAPVDLIGAAGLGLVDALASFFDAEGRLRPEWTPGQLLEAFAYACAYGRVEAVKFLLDRGVSPAAELTFHGAGHTGLHVAAFHAHTAVVALLLERGAPVDVVDKTWGTTPIVWAHAGARERPDADRSAYDDVVARLENARREPRR